MKSDWLKYLYTWLGILVISLPVAIVYWRAIKRGKSARTTAPFVLPYLVMLALAFFWITGVRGVALLGVIVLIVVFTVGVFYVYTEVLDVGHGLSKK